jgi:chromate transport protein ChrA
MAPYENIDRQRLQQRLRALLIVGSLLAPSFCGFSMLALMLVTHSASWVHWLLLVLWAVIGGLLALVVARILKTFRALNDGSNE